MRLRHANGAVRCAFVAALLTAGLPVHAAPVDATAVAAHAAAMADSDRRGVMLMMNDATQRIEAPIYHESTRSRAWSVLENGVTEAAGYLSFESNGKSESAGELARTSAAADAAAKNHTNAPHSVLRSGFQAEYRFSDEPCPNCTEGERAVRYESDRHDAAHTSGVIVVDASGRVARVITRPYIYPTLANDGGEYTTTFGPVLDGKHLPISTIGTYRGHRGPMKGTITFEQRFTYRRFATVDEAVAAAKSS